MAAKAAIRYAVVDAFTDRPFKGNQAVVCFLPDDEERDVEWMKSVVMEFNLPMTVFLSHDTTSAGDDPEKLRFRLRWFTPAREIAPDWRQAMTLKKVVEDRIAKDGAIGIGIAATAVGLLVGGIAAVVARKR